jgi:hypothetical protein
MTAVPASGKRSMALHLRQGVPHVSRSHGRGGTKFSSKETQLSELKTKIMRALEAREVVGKWCITGICRKYLIWSAFLSRVFRSVPLLPKQGGTAEKTLQQRKVRSNNKTHLGKSDAVRGMHLPCVASCKRCWSDSHIPPRLLS